MENANEKKRKDMGWILAFSKNSVPDAFHIFMKLHNKIYRVLSLASWETETYSNSCKQ